MYYFQSYNLAIAIAMACVQDANKEAHIANDNEKGLEEDLAKLKVKQELTKVAKGDTKKLKEASKKAESKKALQEKDDGKIEVGPEEFMKHPLQVSC